MIDQFVNIPFELCVYSQGLQNKFDDNLSISVQARSDDMTPSNCKSFYSLNVGLNFTSQSLILRIGDLIN